MKNDHFGSLTPAMKQYRQKVLDTLPEIDASRAMILTDSYQRNKAKPWVMKRALGLKDILEQMPIYIEEETCLAGNQASQNRAAPIFPEYTMEFVLNELDKFALRDGDVFQISEETKDQLRSIAPFWEGNNLRARGLEKMPAEMQVYMHTGLFGMEGKLNAGDGHIVVDHESLLTKGLQDVYARADAYSQNLDLTDPASIDKRVFYEAVKIVTQATKAFSERYAQMAEQMADKTDDENRRNALLELASICRKVPWEPAETFQEALQAVWLMQVVLQIESNGHSYSFGRLDQYLYPYYEKEEDKQRAEELLTNLWIKSQTINKVRSQSHTLSSAGSPMYQNVTIGGQTPEGKDAVNSLSFAILKTIGQTRLPQPNLTVRYHRNIDPAFIEEAMELLKLGTGMPAFNSDEVIIPSFVEKGVQLEDARDYSAVGCVETAVPGRWGYRCTGMSYLNFPRLLLCVLNDGIDQTTGERFAQGYGTLEDFETFDDLMDAWDKTIRELTRASVIVENVIDMASETEVPDILCSALVHDCLERGKTIKEGGARYDYISGLQVGIADMADSLMAIKKTIYEDKSISKAALMNALKTNFETEEGKAIQKKLLAAPKYGNDIDEVDQLIVDAYASYIDEMKKYPNTRHGRGPIGGIRYAGTSSITANVGQGLATAATPNGRKAFTPLAEGSSPSHGQDKNGPTAVFKSVSKLPTHEITGGVLLNQKVSPSLLATKENTKKLELLIRTFFNRLDGYHVQYNVVDKATLIDAQKHPERHQDLIVRVAGYSAFFNVLSRTSQDDIIARTEQTL